MKREFKNHCLLFLIVSCVVLIIVAARWSHAQAPPDLEWLKTPDLERQTAWGGISICESEEFVLPFQDGSLFQTGSIEYFGPGYSVLDHNGILLFLDSSGNMVMRIEDLALKSFDCDASGLYCEFTIIPNYAAQDPHVPLWHDF